MAGLARSVSKEIKPGQFLCSSVIRVESRAARRQGTLFALDVSIGRLFSLSEGGISSFAPWPPLRISVNDQRYPAAASRTEVGSSLSHQRATSSGGAPARAAARTPLSCGGHPPSADCQNSDTSACRVKANERNPRQRMRGVPELASSMKTYGLLQPVVVRPVEGGYVLLAGHRRVAAARSLGWESIPAIVRPATDDEAYLLTIVDNLQRQDLSPREESAALEALVRERGWSTRQVAAAISRSQAFVSKRLRVFDDPALGPAVLANQVSVSAAEELLSIPAPQRPELLRKIVRGKWDLARVRQAVVAARFGPVEVVAPRRAALGRHIDELLEDLRGLSLGELRASERRQLRRLYAELAFVA